MNIFKKLLGGVTALSLVVGFFLPTVTLAAGPSAVDLGSADDFTILTKAGISTTGSTAITGDIGVSPVASTYITGFGLSLAAESAFATSPLVTGKVYAPGYANPTPTMLTTAVSDMETAYTDGAGRTNPTATELGAGNIGGLTISPGLYKWGTGVSIPSDVTLSGGANDVWIFQVAQSLNVSSGARVILSGGAQASNIFWIVAGQATLGTTADFKGIILGKTAIVLSTGATLQGRALAQTAVTLDANVVTNPGSASEESDEVVIIEDATEDDSSTDASSDDEVVEDNTDSETSSDDEVTSDDSMEDRGSLLTEESSTDDDRELGISEDSEGRRVAASSSQTGISPIDQTRQAISRVYAGQLIRSKNSDAVYYVGSDNKRHVFWDARTYATWSSSWNDVVWVTDATMPTLSLGSPMLPKPGVTLVKIKSDPKVYEVETDSSTGDYILRHVASESVAAARYGQRWADYIIDVEPTLMTHYTVGAEVSSTQSVDRSDMKTRAQITAASQE